jgi:hypothetical protein
MRSRSSASCKLPALVSPSAGLPSLGGGRSLKNVCPSSDRVRGVEGRVHTRHPAGFAESRPCQSGDRESRANARLERQARGRVRHDELAVRVSACRASISTQARMGAHGLDGRHQIHEGLAATAMNGGDDHERNPTKAGAQPPPCHRHLTALAGDRAQLATGTSVPTFL